MAFEGEEAPGTVVEVTLRLNRFVRFDPHSLTEVPLFGTRLEHMVDSLR